MNTKKIIVTLVALAAVGGLAWWVMKGKSNTAANTGADSPEENGGGSGANNSGISGELSVTDLSKKATDIKLSPDGSQVKTDSSQVIKVSPQDLKVQLPSGTATSGGNLKVSVG